MATATPIPNAITVEVDFRSASLLILTTRCESFAALRALPRAVTFDGIACALSAWNSDRDHAVYRSDKTVALASY